MGIMTSFDGNDDPEEESVPRHRTSPLIKITHRIHNQFHNGLIYKPHLCLHGSSSLLYPQHTSPSSLLPYSTTTAQ